MPGGVSGLVQRREHRLSAGRAPGERPHHLRLVVQVEMLQRFVEQQDVRVLQEDLRDAGALALPAGKRAVALSRAIDEVELGEPAAREKSSTRASSRPPTDSPITAACSSSAASRGGTAARARR